MLQLTHKQLLDYKFYITEMNGISTLREYFRTLLTTLWAEEQNFSGKRPLGDSGWQTTLAFDLIKADLFYGLSVDDEYDDFDFIRGDFDRLIKGCIDEL
jgi:hypothetical protein